MQKRLVILFLLIVAFGYSNAQTTLGKPVIVEIISPKGSAFKFGVFADMKGYGIQNIQQWNNLVIVYANTISPEQLKKRIAKDFPADQVILFQNPFYDFNRKYCDNKTVAKQWDNIILTANLVNNPKMQQEYLNYHATQLQKWPEVSQGFKTGRQLMLVISIPKGESLDKLNPLTTKNNPRVDDWNNMMKKYQEGVAGTKKGETWVVFKNVNEKKFIE